MLALFVFVGARFCNDFELKLETRSDSFLPEEYPGLVTSVSGFVELLESVTELISSESVVDLIALLYVLLASDPAVKFKPLDKFFELLTIAKKGNKNSLH